MEMTGKVKKILEEIHPLHIIREVQKWPALYARESCPERASPHFRRKVWAEIGKALFPDWDIYSKMERHNKISDLNKKWRNLRDTFKRQVEVEKKIKEGQKINKKMYVYYNHMSFLLPHLQSDSEQEERRGAAAAAAAAAGARVPVPAPGTPAPAPAPAPAGRLHRRPPPPHARRLRRPRADDIDEDRHFLMSLIPSFRRMTDDQKLTAKVAILQVIKRIRNTNLYGEVDALAYAVDVDVDADVDVKKEMLDVDEAEIGLDLEPEDAADSDGDDDDTE